MFFSTNADLFSANSVVRIMPDTRSTMKPFSGDTAKNKDGPSPGVVKKGLEGASVDLAVQKAVKDLEQSLLNSLAVSLKATIRDNMSRLEEVLTLKVTNLESKLSAEITQLKCDVNDLSLKSAVIPKLRQEVNKLSERCDSYESSLHSSKSIISGIPLTASEDVNGLLKMLSDLIGHSLSPYTKAFRVKRKSNDGHKQPTPPLIVVNFSCVAEKNAFYHLYLEKRDAVTLDKLGFNINHRFFVNDSLSAKSRGLLKAALAHKKTGHLASVLVRNGTIFIKRADSQDSELLKDVAQL